MNEEFLSKPIVVLDIETTGLDFEKGAKIIQLAAVKILDGKIVDAYKQEIKPIIGFRGGQEVLKEIEEGAYKVHQIGMNMLKDKPSFSQILDGFLSYIKDTVVVAHNGDSFDIPFLNKEIKNVQRTENIKDFASKIEDTLKLARAFEANEKKQSLDALIQRHSSPEFYIKMQLPVVNSGENIEIDLKERSERHDALVDCALTAQFLLKMLKTKWDLSLLKDFSKKTPLEFEPIFPDEGYQPVIATSMKKGSKLSM